MRNDLRFALRMIISRHWFSLAILGRGFVSSDEKPGVAPMLVGVHG